MPATNPRRAVDMVQPILTGILIFFVGFGANAITGKMGTMSKGLQNMEVKLATLETTVKVGMADRFTGSQGRDMLHRVEGIEANCKETREKLEFHLSKGAFQLHRELHRSDNSTTGPPL